VLCLVSFTFFFSFNAGRVAMALELAAETRKEDGCIFYDFLQVRGSAEPGTFRIVEKWASLPHLQAHAATDHFTRLVPAMDAVSTTVSFAKGVDALGDLTVPPAPPGLVDFIGTCAPRRARILVMYDSSTLCTTKMAELVAAGARLLDRTEVRLRRVGGQVNHWDKPGVMLGPDPECTFADVSWADGVACGTPTNLGCVSWRMKKFWDDFSQQGGWGTSDGKVGCSFSSQGGHAGGGELVCMAMNNIMLNFGFSVFGVTDYISFK
jgi:quinol monooxygenase YgiN